MRKNRLIVSAGITGIAIAVLCSSAFAATTIEKIEVAEGVVTVSGETDATDAVTYEVYSSKVTSPVISDIVGFGEVDPEGDGGYEVEFGLKAGGSFKVRIFDGVKRVIGEFDYASVEDREKFIEKVNEIIKSDGAAAKLEDELTNSDNKPVIDTIGIKFDTYGGYLDKIKKLTCEKLAEFAKGETLTESEFYALYNDALMIARLNVDGEASVEEIMAKLNYSFEEIAFDKMSGGKQAYIENAVVENTPYESMDELEEMFAKASALYEINNARISNIESMVNGYAALLEIENESEYKRYKAKANSTVNINLVNALEDNEAMTVNDLLEALDDAVPNTTKPGGSGSSGGGGASSSGGRGTISGGSASVSGGYVIEETADEAKPSESQESSSVFRDMNTAHWAYSAVSELRARGVIDGYGDGTFVPDRTVTREEFVKMIVVAFGLEKADARSSFIDVFESDWFYPYVSAAYERGVVKGDHLGLFGVGMEITRQDAATIAARVMRETGIEAQSVREYAGFADEMQISDYAAEEIKTLYCAEKINGTDRNTFEPLRACTRAEAAAIIHGIMR